MKLERKTLLALVFIQVTFASNYLFSKVVMQVLPPLVWGAFRTLATMLLLFLVLFLKREWNVPLALKNIRPLIVFSILGVVLNQAAFLSGLHLTTAANSGLINTLIPVFTILWVTLWKHERLSGSRWLGFALALLGVLFLQDFSHLSLSSRTVVGDSLTVVNAFCYSWFLFLSPTYLKKLPPLWLTAWLFLFGSLGLGLLSFPQWGLVSLMSLSSHTLWFMFWGILIGNLIPYLLISFVLSKAPSSVISQFIYLQALIAGFLGWMFLDESLSLNTFVAAAFIFTGLYLSISSKKKAVIS